ncbi:MAG: glycine--tRNA ligase subunit alpha [Actinobacteria bacterium]|nr:glycine--tRNA ligase subunit alpha [Actinomycetota bacterium]
MNFQDIIFNLQKYWAEKGCIIRQPLDLEKGAGTFNADTFLRCLGPEPWNVAYVEPSRRPTDGRYGENPFRTQFYYQFQVLLKPSPDDVVQQYLGSLERLGIGLECHDIRFVEDDWQSPTIGAAGLGWEVWADGMEITQFTYFQQMGGFSLKPVSAELTYGLERIAMYLQDKDSFWELKWNGMLTYGDILLESEKQWSEYNFEVANIEMLKDLFKKYELEFERTISKNLVYPAHEYVLKCSHVFNLLDAREAISVSERTLYIAKVRNLAKTLCAAYIQQREDAGYPLLKSNKAVIV